MKKNNRSSRSRFPAIVVGCISVFVLIIGLRPSGEPHTARESVESFDKEIPKNPVTPSKQMNNSPPGDAFNSWFDEALSELAEGDGDAAVKKAVEKLRDLLPDLPVDALKDFYFKSLGTRVEAEFSLDSAGRLRSASSMQAILLNLLADSDSEFALGEAAQLLGSTNDAELHSVAMQTVSKLSKDSSLSADLDSAITYHLKHEAWLSEPSAGFLQGFDLAVAHPSSEQADIMLNLETHAQDDSVQFAARLVLDRWSQNDYDWTIENIQNSSEFWEVDYRLRAQTFARADPESETESILLMNHLEDPKTSMKEAERIISLYPLISNQVSYNLVTTSRPPSHSAAKERVGNASQFLAEFARNTVRPELIPLLEQRAGYLSE